MTKQTAEPKATLGPLEWDEETGLPKLPKGFVWEVSQSSVTNADGTRKLWVSIRKEKVIKATWLDRLFGEKDRTVLNYTHELDCVNGFAHNSPEGIKKGAEAAYKAGLIDQEQTALLGIYPPKSLNK